MNIVLINHYAGSVHHGMEYRPFYMAREWVRLGHNVTVIAASQSHLRSRQPDVRGNVSTEWFDGVRYLWLRTPPYEGNGVRRVINMMAFVGALVYRIRSLAEELKPDAVIASSTYPLDVVPAALLSSRTRAKLIFEVHDLWPLTPIEIGGMSPRHPYIRLLQWAENYAYRRADRVASLLPKAEPHMEEHGLRPGKFFYIPNGIDTSEWEANEVGLPAGHAEAIDALAARSTCLVAYAGAHGLANGLDTLLEAARLLRGERVGVVLVGQGPEKESLQARAVERGLDNVLFLPPVPKTAVPALLRRVDILYIGFKKSSIFRFGISPNKLMDYMMAGKPIVQAIEAGNDMVGESGCGISVAPGDPAAVAEAVRKLAALPAPERERMGQSGRAYVLSNHDYHLLAQRFLSLMS